MGPSGQAIEIYSHTQLYALHFIAFLQTVCTSASWSRSISIIFPTAFAHFLSLCLILAILTIFQTLPWQKDNDSLKAQVMASIF